MSDQRERILAEACELYLSQGMGGFSMRKLARAIGVTAPALYKHYDSREAVLLDVIAEGYRLLARGLYAALGGATPVERFAKAGAAHLDFALRHRRYYELIYTHPRLLGIDTLPPEVEAQACAIHQFFIDRLRECMAAGIIREGDPKAAALTFWSHHHGMISLYLSGMLTDDAGEPVDRETFRTLHMESGLRLLRGMAEPEGVDRILEAAAAGLPESALGGRSDANDRVVA